MTITFIDPVADCLAPVNGYGLSLDLSQPVTVGLMVNRIPQCDVFMRHVEAELTKARPDISVRFFETGTITFADEATISEIAGSCDAAICAIGHCGSCTAGTVKDGIHLIERGIPAVSLITELFWAQAEALAVSLGWPDAPRVQLPYPIWGTDDGSMRHAATKAVTDLLPLLETTHHVIRNDVA